MDFTLQANGDAFATYRDLGTFSKGVAIAFYNTLFGLSVATATVVAYLFVSTKQSKEMTRMEAATASVVDHLLLLPEARKAGRAPAAHAALS